MTMHRRSAVVVIVGRDKNARRCRNTRRRRHVRNRQMAPPISFSPRFFSRDFSARHRRVSAVRREYLSLLGGRFGDLNSGQSESRVDILVDVFNAPNVNTADPTSRDYSNLGVLQLDKRQAFSVSTLFFFFFFWTLNGQVFFPRKFQVRVSLPSVPYAVSRSSTKIKYDPGYRQYVWGLEGGRRFVPYHANRRNCRCCTSVKPSTIVWNGIFLRSRAMAFCATFAIGVPILRDVISVAATVDKTLPLTTGCTV